MAFINYNSNEIIIKTVYYGPSLSGKTTCLKTLSQSKRIRLAGKMINLNFGKEEGASNFFEFLPLTLKDLGAYSVKLELYAVPGQHSYERLRQNILQKADGIIFVADSRREMLATNSSCFRDLEKNMRINNLNQSDCPVVIQYNKRDMPGILSINELNSRMNPTNHPFYPAVAHSEEKVIGVLHEILNLILHTLKKKLSIFEENGDYLITQIYPESNSESSRPENDLVAGPGGVNAMAAYSEPVASSAPISLDPELTIEPEGFDLEDDFQLDDYDLELQGPLNNNVQTCFSGQEFSGPPPGEIPEMNMGIGSNRDDVDLLQKRNEVNLPLSVEINEDQVININLKITIHVKRDD